MKIADKFRELKIRNEGAHMSHVYYGDPYEKFSLRLIQTLVKNGTDILEFGIPFSDPTADGPTFQAVCKRALENGMTPSRCMEGIQKLRVMGIEIPIVITTYYNIPFVMGVGNFLERVRKAGAQAVIVPNVPIEEAEELLTEGKKSGIEPIFFVAPTTPEDRLRKIVDVASGFLYVMGVEGVTGVRESLGKSTLRLVTRVRKHTDMPLLVGFGISNGKQASEVVEAGADGAIAGSVYAKIYEKNLQAPEETLPQIAEVINDIKRGCNEGYNQRNKSAIDS